ncbi:hypothetical protein CRUP_016421, partial [Coryphaenoides rupestris]
MDLPDLSWQEHVVQKWGGLPPEIKHNFISLQEVDAVFKFAAELTTHEDVDFLHGVAKGGPCVQKDSAEAALCREQGNGSFKIRDYAGATLHYSQSSEQLSLCYANRSASLYRLQRYQHGYPPHLRHKLEERREQCLGQLSAGPGEEGTASTSQRDHGVADATAQISPHVSVRFHREKGRHLVATEGIAAGGLIMVDRPYSCVLIPGTGELKRKPGRRENRKVATFGTQDWRCHRCLCETVSAVPCERCSYSRYCSDACRHLAWEEHHRWECPIGAELSVTGLMSQLALRVVLKAGWENVQRARERTPGAKGLSHSKCSDNDADNGGLPSALHANDSYVSVYRLLHHLSHQSPELRFLCAVTVATLYLKLRRRGRRLCLGAAPDPGLGRTTANRTEARRMGGNTRAGTQNTVCWEVLLNHACLPNTSLAFSAPDPRPAGSVAGGDAGPPRGVSVAVRAAVDIAAGQEILHCYGPHSSRMPKAERQRLLLDQYYFQCGCEACTQQKQQQPGPPGWPEHHGLQCD